MPVSWSDAKTRRGAGRGGGGGPNVGEAALTEGEGLEHGEAEERVGERAMAPLGRADKEDLAVAGGEVPEEVDAPTAKQPRSSIASHEASPLADPVSHKARKAGNILNSFDSTQVPMSGSAMNSGRGHTMYTLYAQNLMLDRAQDEFSAKRTGRGREICSESEEDASRRRGCVVHS